MLRRTPAGVYPPHTNWCILVTLTSRIGSSVVLMGLSTVVIPGQFFVAAAGAMSVEFRSTQMVRCVGLENDGEERHQ